jgi:transposase
MDDGTTLLFALPGYRVLEVSREPDGGRRVLVEAVADEAACPACGVFSRLVHERPVRRVKDLAHGDIPLRVWVRKRRYRCLEGACPRRSFTEATDELPTRSRLTGRLRGKVTAAVTRTNRAVSEVAAEHGIAWGTVHRALVAAAVRRLGQAAPTTRIGIDETRARSVRWLLTEADEASGEAPRWRRTDPWMTSIVDLDPAHAGGILGLAPGRTGACVEAWLELQTPAFRDAVAVVAIDPSAPYAAGIRRALPDARIVVDHWHLIRLANQMVTEVRQRVQREQHGRRGTSADPAWTHRKLLLRAGDTLSEKALLRLKNLLATDDPTDEIGAAWGVKELLRQLLKLNGANYDPAKVTGAHTAFTRACEIAGMPETTRLAATITAWWPQIEGFLELGVTNARTEGYNRVIKQVKRVACGFRNQANYERRIMMHIAATRAA